MVSLNRLRPVLNRTTGRLSLQVERPLSIHGNFRLVSYVVTSDTLAAYGQKRSVGNVVDKQLFKCIFINWKNSQNMLESEFIASIDCRFPYGRPIKWRRVVSQSSAISANAAFMVIHEVCRPPRHVKLPEARTREILHFLLKRFRHPLIRILMPAIDSHIQGKNLPVSKAANLMRQVAKYPHQYNALAICYLSCNDKNGTLEPIYERIVGDWAGT